MLAERENRPSGTASVHGATLAMVPPGLASEISGATPWEIRDLILRKAVRITKIKGITYVNLDDAMAEVAAMEGRR
jgi:hypothetical protein